MDANPNLSAYIPVEIYWRELPTYPNPSTHACYICWFLDNGVGTASWNHCLPKLWGWGKLNEFVYRTPILLYCGIIVDVYIVLCRMISKLKVHKYLCSINICILLLCSWQYSNRLLKHWRRHPDVNISLPGQRTDILAWRSRQQFWLWADNYLPA